MLSLEVVQGSSARDDVHERHPPSPAPVAIRGIRIAPAAGWPSAPRPAPDPHAHTLHFGSFFVNVPVARRSPGNAAAVDARVDRLPGDHV
jgi:hypothetical protein